MPSLFEIDYTRNYCEKCGLYKTCKNPYMPTGGKGRMNAMVIGEAGGRTEDEEGDQFIGENGEILEKEFKKFGFNLHTDFYKDNALCCKSPGNKKPTKTQLKYCHNRLIKAIEKCKPKVIIAVGNSAIDTLMGKYLKTTAVTSLDGNIIPHHELGCWVIPILHPSYINRKKHDKNLISHWDRTVKQALEFCANPKPLKKKRISHRIKYLTTYKQIKELFDKLKKIEKEEDLIATAIDYETSGVDIYNKPHKIFSCAIAIENDYSYSFPIDHPEALSILKWTPKTVNAIKKLLKEYLKGSNYKIAHNSYYETVVSRYVLGVVPTIDWCTMTTQHVIDTRERTTSLKHQAFVRWGLYYDEDAKKYINTVPKTGYNKMHKQSLTDQLRYVGIDALITCDLFLEQEKEIPNVKATKFFNKAVRMLEKVSYNGIRADINYYKRQEKELNATIKKHTNEILNSEEMQEYLKLKGWEEINIDSPEQMRPFFYDYLKIKEKRTTEKGLSSLDKIALSEMNNWIADSIINRRELGKQLDYIRQILNNSSDGWLHPQFLLNTARTLRSSAVKPSLQNFPKRNDEAKKRIRGGIKGKEGHKIIEADFSGIEVATSAIYHQDPNFIRYLKDAHSDMHRDNGCDLFSLKENEITKKIRFYAKNGWTFPQFYGDFYGSCAESLWENCLELPLANGKIIKEHLQSKSTIMRLRQSGLIQEYKKDKLDSLEKSEQTKVRTAIKKMLNKGITNLEIFKEYCRMVEYFMWYKRFPVYTAWKDKAQLDYQEKGYVETKFGFKFIGFLDKKQVANYPIQGTAFHILLWCMIQVQNVAKRENWESFLMGEIHDSMILSVAPHEEEKVKDTIHKICTEWVVNEFNWINIPYEIDIETSEIDGSWKELD